MSESRKSRSRSKSKQSRRSNHDQFEECYSDYDSNSYGGYYRSHKEERRRHYSRSPDSHSKRQGKSHSSERVRENIDDRQIKSLVKIPLPSLLSPRSLIPTGNKSIVKAQVVQNKPGQQRKGRVAKSLMDLQFEDRTQSTGIYHGRDKRKSDRVRDQVVNLRRNNLHPERNDEVDVWFSPKESKRLKRSWKESDASSSHAHSLFSSCYKPLVIESEPVRKVQKLQKLPKPLLQSEILPSLSLSVPRGMLSSQGVLKRKSHDTGSCASVNNPEMEALETVQHSDKIVKINSDKKNIAYLVVPFTLPWVHLHGRAKIKVLRGVVTILAHTLVPGTSYEVFSPSSNCLLSLQVDPTDFLTSHDVKTELESVVKKNLCGLDELSEKSIGIIKVERLDSLVCDYVTSLPPFTKLFTPKPHLSDAKKSSDSAGVVLFNGGLKVAPESEMGLSCMSWDDRFNDALDRWLETVDKKGSGDESPVFMTCGAKNTGKSMFNRCAINTTLRCVQEVAYLDCDVGQTEFSPPATLSLHIIRKPILSPPFCHQRNAESMVFYGDNSPAQDPTNYIHCLEYVFKAYKELASGKMLPLIVNTMGFPEGIGFMLLVDTLNITSPDLVVQFESDLHYANFPPVSQEMIALDEGWIYNKCPPPNVKERLAEVKEHSLIMLPSVNKNERIPTSHKLHPADLRNLAMFSSLSMSLGENETLISMTPQVVPYRNLAIHVCRYNLPIEEILLAIDASVVALCSSDLNEAKRSTDNLPLTFNAIPICECLGLGIVRAVDMDKGLLYISTSLPRHLLRRANTILKGTPALPDHFIIKQQSISDQQVPYVDSLAQATATFGLRARSRMPRIHTHAKRFV